MGLIWAGALWAGGPAPPDSAFCVNLGRVASASVQARQAGVPLATLKAIADQQPVPARNAIWATTLFSYPAASADAAREATLARCRKTQALVAEDLRRRAQGLPPLGPLPPEDEAWMRDHGP